MADLGTLQTYGYDPIFSPVISGLRPLVEITGVGSILQLQEAYNVCCLAQVWTSLNPAAWGIPDGHISGAVTENSVGVSKCVVRLYHRESGKLLLSTFTDSSGLYTFNMLNSADSNAYTVIAFDPDLGTQYNAIVFDRITAVV